MARWLEASGAEARKSIDPEANTTKRHLGTRESEFHARQVTGSAKELLPSTASDARDPCGPDP